MVKEHLMCLHFTEEKAWAVLWYLGSIGKECTVRRLKASNCKKQPISITVRATYDEQRELYRVYEQMGCLG